MPIYNPPTKYTDVEVQAIVDADIATHAAIAAAHHAKYTDAETVIAAKTVKLDDFAAPDDNTDLNFSTTKHGLTPKGADVGKFLKDDGSWANAAGGVGVSGTPTDGQVAVWTDADTIEGSAIGTIFIAANDATTAEKVRALASGGYVCDGTWHVITLEDCTDKTDWTAGANATLSDDAGDKGDGSGSVKITVGAGAGADEVLAYADIPLTDISRDGQRVSVRFWLKSDVALDNDDIRILLDDAAGAGGFGTPLETFEVAASDAATWYHYARYCSTPDSDTAVISVGVLQHVDKGACNIWIGKVSVEYGDDYEIQKAIDTVETNGQGKIGLSSGTFEGYGVALASNLDIRGQGIDVTTFKLHEDILDAECWTYYRSCLFGVDKYDTGLHNIHIADMTLNGNKDNQDQNPENVISNPAAWYMDGIGYWNATYDSIVNHVKFVDICSAGLYIESQDSKIGVSTWEHKRSSYQHLWFDSCGKNDFQESTVKWAAIYIDMVFDNILGDLHFKDSINQDIIIVDSNRIWIDGYISTDNAATSAFRLSPGNGEIYLNNFDIRHPAGDGINASDEEYVGPCYISNGRIIGKFILAKCGVNLSAGSGDYTFTNVNVSKFHKGFYLLNAVDIDLINCNVENNMLTGTTSGSGIDLDACTRINIKGCKSRWNEQVGIRIDDSTDVTVEGCTITSYRDDTAPALNLASGASSGQAEIIVAANGVQGAWRYIREGDKITITEGGVGSETQRIQYAEHNIFTCESNLANTYTTAAEITYVDGDHTYDILESGTNTRITYKNNNIKDGVTRLTTLQGSDTEYDDKASNWFSPLDLSGAATDVDIYRVKKAGILTGYTIHYTEASSANAGVSIDIGRYQDGVALDDDYFDTTTSEVNKNLGYSTYITFTNLTNKTLSPGDIITVGTAGGKTGTGEVVIELDIMYGVY